MRWRCLGKAVLMMIGIIISVGAGLGSLLALCFISQLLIGQSGPLVLIAVIMLVWLTKTLYDECKNECEGKSKDG